MVCLGNICRSPLADGLLRKKVKALNLPIEVDSAGTIGIHADEAPDPRMIETAAEFGVDISTLRGRQINALDLDDYDEIFVMDRSNYQNVLKLANEDNKHKVKFMLNETYANEDREVPDPYFGGKQGFIDVYKMLDRATDHLIDRLKKNYEG